MNNIENLVLKANGNLLKLSENPYPGRGIIIGIDESGKYLVQVYWIMGRSEHSRNRVFEIHPSGELRTAFADPNKGGDPSLVIYTAMAERGADGMKIYAVSNGSQTGEIVGPKISSSMSVDLQITGYKYEPDSPNFTPRISARSCLLKNGSSCGTISILKKSPFYDMCESSEFDRLFYPGFGWCVHTYKGDDNPLPSFEGEPYLMRIKGSPKDVAESFWSNLDEDNRVSIAVKFIEIATGKSEIEVINKYEKVG